MWEKNRERERERRQWEKERFTWSDFQTVTPQKHSETGKWKREIQDVS